MDAPPPKQCSVCLELLYANGRHDSYQHKKRGDVYCSVCAKRTINPDGLRYKKGKIRRLLGAQFTRTHVPEPEYEYFPRGTRIVHCGNCNLGLYACRSGSICLGVTYLQQDVYTDCMFRTHLCKPCAVRYVAPKGAKLDDDEINKLLGDRYEHVHTAEKNSEVTISPPALARYSSKGVARR